MAPATNTRAEASVGHFKGVCADHKNHGLKVPVASQIREVQIREGGNSAFHGEGNLYIANSHRKITDCTHKEYIFRGIVICTVRPP